MILVAGDIMLDVLLLPDLQEEEQGGGLLVRGGGSAANTAAWLGAYDTVVTFVGCVGDDPAGAMLTDELRCSGVNTQIRVVPGETGCVAVELASSGERVMRSSRGANQMLAPNDLIHAVPSGGVAAVHLTGYALLGPTGLELLETAAQIAKRNGALLSFDPSSLGVIGRIGPQELLHALTGAGVQLLLPNAVEAEALSGESNPASMALKLALMFEQVAIKLGSDGAVAAQAGQASSIRTQPVAAVDTTGAGDAFNAGVLRGLALGHPLFDAVAVGNQFAGQCVTNYGARPVVRHSVPRTQP